MYYVDLYNNSIIIVHWSQNPHFSIKWNQSSSQYDLYMTSKMYCQCIILSVGCNFTRWHNIIFQPHLEPCQSPLVILNRILLFFWWFASLRYTKKIVPLYILMAFFYMKVLHHCLSFSPMWFYIIDSPQVHKYLMNEFHNSLINQLHDTHPSMSIIKFVCSYHCLS